MLVVPASPREIVNVSDALAVTKTISSLVVSGSKASVNWSPLTNPDPWISAAPVPEATVIEVALELIPEASVVSMLVELNLRVVIGLPYLL